MSINVNISNCLENVLKEEINNEGCNTVLQFLLRHLKNGELSYGTINASAIKFNVYCNSISCLLKLAKTSEINDDEIFNARSPKKLENMDGKIFLFLTYLALILG